VSSAHANLDGQIAIVAEGKVNVVLAQSVTNQLGYESPRPKGPYRTSIRSPWSRPKNDRKSDAGTRHLHRVRAQRVALAPRRRGGHGEDKMPIPDLSGCSIVRS